MEFTASNLASREGGGVTDWPALKRAIVERLDVAAEYARLGVEFTRAEPNAKGVRECRAYGREDRTPSAFVNTRTGVYHDSGGGGLSLHLFDFALRFGGFGRWIDVVKSFAERAGVPMGPVKPGKGGRVREAAHLYRDEAGAVRYAVFRYRLPSGAKSFSQHPPDGRGGWKYGPGCMEGVGPLPYRLPELLAADPEDPVWVVEGEKDADRLAALGLVATTNHQGAGSTDATWPAFRDRFAGRDVVILPDNDDAGRRHARKVAGYLHGVARRVKVVELPGLGRGGDVSDWLDLGHDPSELCSLAAEAPEFDPATSAEPDAAPAPEPDGAELVRLSDVVATEVRWLWPGRFPLGKVSLLAGEAKLGKSFLMLDFAARVSAGAEIPCGAGECMPSGSVILLSAEDDLDDTVKPRLDAAGADTTRIHALTMIRREGRLEPFSLDQLVYLESAIRRLGDVVLVILDPVTQYVGAHVDDNKNAQLRAVLGPLKTLAKDCQVAILLITHLNKGTGVKALARVIGSSAYTALARANWLVVRDAQDPKRRLMLSAGCNLAEEQTGLAYRVEAGRVVWEDAPVDMTADDALAAERDHREAATREANPSKIEQAEAWLASLFPRMGIDIPSSDIFLQGRAKGFGRDVLQEAKARRHIRARKVGFRGPWVWYLDEEPDREEPDDSQPPGSSGSSDPSEPPVDDEPF